MSDIDYSVIGVSMITGRKKSHYLFYAVIVHYDYISLHLSYRTAGEYLGIGTETYTR